MSKKRVAVAFVWLAAVVGATALLAEYSNTPSLAGNPPEQWPAQSHLSTKAGLPTLLVFVHPKCPCSRASLGELEKLMTRCSELVATHVVFLKPEGMTEDWARTDLWRTASAIPGVVVDLDHDGNEAKRFHSESSGQSVLYDAAGSLLFSGGITVSRGHSGDNPGAEAIAAMLRKQPSALATTPVFGCPLFESECGEGGVVRQTSR